ncbi:hypothetical protein SDC9_127306 [bioreactor metagenome]|uniref:Uncharacterized protein n=1 Tax=bioreactor metagenome TaxID=1076179 RepID=A0A645CTN4_9ZZZZ
MRARFISPVKALKYVRKICLRYSRPVIGNGHPGLSVQLLQRNIHFSVLGGVRDGVAKQIQEHLFNAVVVAIDLCLVYAEQIQLHLFASQDVHLLDHFQQNAIQRDFHQIKRHTPRFSLVQEQ